MFLVSLLFSAFFVYWPVISPFSQVSVEEARKTVDLWYGDRKEVLDWQEARKEEALNPKKRYVLTLLGRARRFPLVTRASRAQRGHIARAAINTPVQVLVLVFSPSFCLCLCLSNTIVNCYRAVLLMWPCVPC